MYESPINLAVRDMAERVEDDLVAMVQSFGWEIDKEELAKALQYDRDQYYKGYTDALKERTVKVLNECEGFYSAHGVCMIGHCDECGNLVCNDFNYCPTCGAKLEWK